MNNIFYKHIKIIGFNLIELMITLAILSIIAAVAITQYNLYLKKVAIATATSLADNIKARVMLYYTDQEQFPSETNGNATEINNTFNISALDSNTRKNIKDVRLYAKGDPSYPALPASISAYFSSRYDVLGYIKIDFDPSRKLSTDPANDAQLFLVAFQVNNRISLNTQQQYLHPNAPKLVLATNSDSAPDLVWQQFQSNVNTPIKDATPSCPGNQLLRSVGCALCNAGTYTNLAQGTCVPCDLGKYSNTDGATQCTNCPARSFASSTGSTACTPCSTGIDVCNATTGGAISCIAAVAPATYTLQGQAGQAGSICQVNCSGSNYAGTDNVCHACPANCSACTSSTACSSCITGYYGANCAYSISSCNGVISGSGVTAICGACPTNAICSGGTITVCQSGYYGNNCSSSISSCNGIISGSGATATCSACPTNAICSGGVITGCQSGYYGNNCSSSISSCNGIISGSGITATCTACPTHAICSGEAITGCQTGYYGANCASSISSCAGIISGSGITATCNPCPTNAVCSGGVITGCQNGKYLYNNACYASCPSGTFLPGIGTTCYACPSSCTTCYATNYCTACNTGAGYYYLYNNNCIQSCPTGYTPSGSTCVPSCSGYKYNGTCYSSCPKGTYPAGTIGVDAICVSCSVIMNCSSCTGTAPNPICTQCNSVNTPSEYYPDLTPSKYWPIIYLQNGRCVQWCSSGQYLVISSKTCVDSCPAGTTTNNSPYGANGIMVASGSCS